MDLRDVIRNKDAHDQIENRRQERDRIECERHGERDYDYYGLFYDQPHRHCSPKGGCNEGVVQAFFHDLKRVCWPLNFKSSGIKKYYGSTNPTEWLELYQLAIEVAGGDSYVMANYLPDCLSLSVSPFLVPLIMAVHQQLLGHMCTSGSQLGPSQHGAKEARVPPRIYSAILQQKK
jgi:hypothetical protein